MSTQRLMIQAAHFLIQQMTGKYHLYVPYYYSCNFSGSQWSGEGCGVDTVRSMSNYTVCNCYHLTTFALLMSPTGAAVSLFNYTKIIKVLICLECQSTSCYSN